MEDIKDDKLTDDTGKSNTDQDLKILPLVEDETAIKNALKKDIHPNLPDIKRGALLCVVASIRSGKTTLLNNLFAREAFFKDCFDKSFFISPTIYSDKSMRFIREMYSNTCYDQYDDDIIYKICKYQESQPLEDRGSYSLVADDCIDIAGRKNSALVFLASRFRHYSQKASMVVFSTQKFRSLNPILRVNTTDFLISDMKNTKERMAIIEEFADAYDGEENFTALWRQATQEPYSFLYLKLDKTPPEAYRNFEEKIYPAGPPNEEEHEHDPDEILEAED